MKTVFKTFMLAAALLAAGASSAGEDMNIQVSARPALPARNLLQGKVANIDFSEGLKGWKIREDNSGTFEALSENGNGFIRCTLNEGTALMAYRMLPMSFFRKGESYILSCRIRPLTPLPAMTYKDGGPGFDLKFHAKDWSKGTNFCSRTATGREVKDKWITVTGAPRKVPDYAQGCQFDFGFFYYNKQKNLVADIDDLAVYPAYTTLSFSVQAKEAPIHQVKVLDENENEIFSTPVLKNGSKSFSHSLRVETTRRYTVMALLEDGSVDTASYPRGPQKQ